MLQFEQVLSLLFSGETLQLVSSYFGYFAPTGRFPEAVLQFLVGSCSSNISMNILNTFIDQNLMLLYGEKKYLSPASPCYLFTRLYVLEVKPMGKPGGAFDNSTRVANTLCVFLDVPDGPAYVDLLADVSFFKNSCFSHLF